MDTKRPERVADLLLEFVSQLLNRQINDPRVGEVTLTRADVTRDLRHARIYFGILAREGEKEEVLSGLKSATGFIRSRIARELRLRFVPTLEFVYDDTQDTAQRIEQLLRQMNTEE